jgi:hypothetical protein
MGFVQIMQYRTSDIDSLRKLEEDWRQATEGKRTVRREILAQDRSDPSRYFNIVFFDSYESAMENSNLPETQAAADKFDDLTEGVTFYDLDVLEDRS